MFDATAFLATVTKRPGVYCMRDKQDKVLYVGKAKNLKHRLLSYFRHQEDQRLKQMVQQIAHIDITVTYSEKEALLLENSLIKSLKPRYNVLFRDDKSYPFLFLSQHTFPRLAYFRGKQKLPGQYFGPYPSALAVRETLGVLQKIFKLRQCDDLFFNNRSRPCLQYQIKRCSAPCVNYISAADYARDVENACLFLAGKETTIIKNLVNKMEQAAQEQSFEKAAALRDQIISLRTICDQQVVHKQKGNLDVIALSELQGHFCIQLLYIRQGRILDSQSYFPKQVGAASNADILRSFLIQFYLDQDNQWDYPHELVLSEAIEDQQLICDALGQIAKKSIKVVHPTRGEKWQWLQLAHENALRALTRKTSQANLVQQRWLELKKQLGITNGLNRVECFDVSHMQGEATIASCVVFDQNGPCKAEYRRYNLTVPANDDYAAIEQVLIRRYLKRKEQDLPLPELVIIDGGKGQLHRAKKALLECQILDVLIMGIAKGAARKPGLETLFVTRMQSEEEFVIKWPPTSSALHLLQNIRDEAHRFAITGQRAKTRKSRKTSPLEQIAGVGAKRRQALLSYFGGQQALLAASETAIAAVPGISKALAAQIYAALHGE